MSDSISRKAAIGSLWMVSWRMVSRGLGLVSTVILARFLAPADFGLVAMATAFAASIDALSYMGTDDALIRRDQDDEALHDAAFTIKLVRGIVTGLLVAALAPAASAWFNEPRLTPILLVLGVIAAIGGADNIGMIAYRRSMDFRLQFQTLLVPRLVQVGVTILAASIFRTYWALIVGLSVGRILYVAATYVLHPYRPRLRLTGWRELAGFSVWRWSASMTRAVWDRIDAFVLGPALGPGRLGAYLLGCETAVLPVTELVVPVASVLFPGFAAARNKGTETIALAPLVSTTLLLAMFPTALAISAASNCIISLLLGPQWAEAQQVIFVLAWACALQPFSYISASVLIAVGHARRDFHAVLGGVIVKVPLLIATVTTGNMVVIALGVLASILIQTLIFIWTLYQVGQPRMSRLFGAWTRIVLSGAVAALALHATGVAWQTDTPGPLVAVVHGAIIGIVAFGVFGIVQWLGWTLSRRPAGPEQILMQNLASLLKLPNKAVRET